MKRSLISSVRLMALAVCSVAVSMASRAVECVVTAARELRDRTFDLVLHAASLAPKQAGQVHQPPSIRIKAARMFLQRIQRRQVPTLTDSWRMCPSV